MCEGVKAAFLKTEFGSGLRNVYRRLRKKSRRLFAWDQFVVWRATAVSSTGGTKELPSDFSFEIVTGLADFQRLEKQSRKMSAMPDRRHVELRLRSGSLLYLFFHGDEVAHASWVHPSPAAAAFDPLFAQLGEGPYIGPCFTLAPFQGRGLYKQMLARIVDDLKRRGVGAPLIYANASNHPSVRAIDRASFSRMPSLRRIQILGRKWIY